MERERCNREEKREKEGRKGQKIGEVLWRESQSKERGGKGCCGEEMRDAGKRGWLGREPRKIKWIQERRENQEERGEGRTRRGKWEW